MTETIEQKALALVNEVSGREWAAFSHADSWTLSQALCRAIEQHEAFRREVSETVEAIAKTWGTANPAWGYLHHFIIPQPDPLVEVMNAWWDADGYASIETFRAALAARGLKIVKKEPSQ